MVPLPLAGTKLSAKPKTLSVPEVMAVWPLPLPTTTAVRVELVLGEVPPSKVRLVVLPEKLAPLIPIAELLARMTTELVVTPPLALTTNLLAPLVSKSSKLPLKLDVAFAPK